MFIETIKLAVQAIARNAMRAFLTVLGVVIGYFPARRAARMNPIDALRHE